MSVCLSWRTVINITPIPADAILVWSKAARRTGPDTQRRLHNRQKQVATAAAPRPAARGLRPAPVSRVCAPLALASILVFVHRRPAPGP